MKASAGMSLLKQYHTTCTNYSGAARPTARKDTRKNLHNQGSSASFQPHKPSVVGNAPPPPQINSVSKAREHSLFAGTGFYTEPQLSLLRKGQYEGWGRGSRELELAQTLLLTQNTFQPKQPVPLPRKQLPPFVTHLPCSSNSSSLSC